MFPPRELLCVRRRPGYVAFCRLLGLKIREGQALDAFRMLQEIGAPGELAHKIVDGWPLEEGQRRTPAEIMTLEEEAAVRFAFFVPQFEQHDWPALLRRAVRFAHACREAEEKPSGGSGSSEPRAEG